jgi:hypothetical protein
VTICAEVDKKVMVGDLFASSPAAVVSVKVLPNDQQTWDIYPEHLNDLQTFSEFSKVCILEKIFQSHA